MKRNKDQEKSSKKGDDKDTGHEKSITKETGNDDGNGERESTPSLISSVSPSLTGRLSVTLGPFSPVGKGIIGQWKQGGELPLFQI